MRVFRVVGTVGLFTLLLSSCYFPPYREELSLALPVTKKMEGVEVVGPLDRSSSEFEGRDLVFYPSKDALKIRTNEYVKGFIVATDNQSARLMYVDHGPLPDDDYYVGFDNTVPLDNSDDKLFTYRVSTVKDGNDADLQELLGIVLADAESNQRELILLDQGFQIISTTAPAPIDLNSRIVADLLPSLPPPPDTLVIGASFLMENTPNSDLFSVLCIDRISGLFAEALYRTDTAVGPLYNGLQFVGPVRAPVVFDIPGLSEDLRNVFYCYNVYDPNLRSYLSYYDSVRRSYRNFSWDDSLQLRVLTKMDRRIDQVFTNNFLFSHDGNKGYVYDGDGELLNSFLMGGLTLVYETADDTLPIPINRVVFTIPVWAPVQMGGGDWEDKLYFLIYWIPTGELADL